MPACCPHRTLRRQRLRLVVRSTLATHPAPGGVAEEPSSIMCGNLLQVAKGVAGGEGTVTIPEYDLRRRWTRGSAEWRRRVTGRLPVPTWAGSHRAKPDADADPELPRPHVHRRRPRCGPSRLDSPCVLRRRDDRLEPQGTHEAPDQGDRPGCGVGAGWDVTLQPSAVSACEASTRQMPPRSSGKRDP